MIAATSRLRRSTKAHFDATGWEMDGDADIIFESIDNNTVRATIYRHSGVNSGEHRPSLPRHAWSRVTADTFDNALYLYIVFLVHRANTIPKTRHTYTWT